MSGGLRRTGLSLNDRCALLQPSGLCLGWRLIGAATPLLAFSKRRDPYCRIEEIAEEMPVLFFLSSQTRDENSVKD